jgi:hypothetical protein
MKKFDWMNALIAAAVCIPLAILTLKFCDYMGIPELYGQVIAFAIYVIAVRILYFIRVRTYNEPA